MRLVGVEIRRALSRRLVRALIVIALIATALTAVLVYRDAAAHGVKRASEDVQGAVLTDLWRAHRGSGTLSITTVFLAIGGLIGGASVIGAEWRAGTMATLLTWEPRRVRVAVVKLAVVGSLAAVIHVLLQAVFAGALLPTILTKGTTAGADAVWWRGAVGAVARGAAITGMAATLGGAIAMIGRNTSATLGAAFAYVMILEQLLRAWRPEFRPWLLGENVAVFFTGLPVRQDPGTLITRSVAASGLTLLLYAVVVSAVATLLLKRSDVTGG